MNRSFFRLLWGCAASCLVAAPSVCSAQTLLPANQRFADPRTEEIPSLQRHVIPLLGRLGCNGRACHGSFQGQGGFRLSLFGYDFVADHAALLGGDEPRVNVNDPTASLILQKPILAIDHDGGERMKKDSWQYRLILKWIQAGALPVQDDDARFVTLEVSPAEVLFSKPGQTAQLQVVAVWSDGSREEVTPLCRFRTNDESVAEIDETGQVTCVGPGDTHVVAFYDNGVGPVPALLPVSDQNGPRFPAVPTPTKIDELVVAKLRKLGIVPSELCSDADFLRRVSLDMTGTLPAPDEVTAFLSDKSPNKRSKKIDELLERPSYAAWWATRLGDYTGNGDQNGPLGGEQAMGRAFSEKWYDWLYRRVRNNVPYDELVEGIALAVGRRPEQTFEEYCAEMVSYYRAENPADFADREFMPYFWHRRDVGQPKGKALSFAYAFLGVRLECAECHKHPYDQWTKQDFDQFTLFFGGVRYGDGPGARERAKAMSEPLGLVGDQDSGNYKRTFVKLVGEGKLIPFKEVMASNRIATPRFKGANSKSLAGRVITPKLLGGEEVVADRFGDPRQAVMEWMRQKDNPYFARAFVNRVWANYFNVGIIEPPDDMNLANPPINEPLLDYLTESFIAQGYDMKWLHREIANSRTYQLSWEPTATNELDERNFSHSIVRRLPAEVAYDALTTATATDAAIHALQNDEAKVRPRAIGVLSGYTAGRDDHLYAVNLFGKPPRKINCDCERSTEPSLLQTVYLRNDQETLSLADRADGWLRSVCPPKGPLADFPEELIRQAYLRTISRPPQPQELQIAQEHVSQAEDVASGLRDVFWVLLNTKEFILNR